jgi:alkylhydroperoxidase family enzyme
LQSIQILEDSSSTIIHCSSRFQHGMRLQYVTNPPKFSNPHEQAIADRIMSHSTNTGVYPLVGTLLISPNFAEGFLEFFSAIRNKSTLPEDVKELAMCRVGALNGAAFEWMHHMPLLKKAGLSDEGIETVRTSKPGASGADGEGGLMTTEIHVSDETFAALKDEFREERQIVELSTVPSPFIWFNLALLQFTTCIIVVALRFND